jgi:RNA polymerase sigma factor (sigma-70 family)
LLLHNQKEAKEFELPMSTERDLNVIINRLRYQLKGIIRKLNLRYYYIDSDDLYQEILLYLWQQNKSGKLKDKNDSYILQGCYYYLKNYIRTHIKISYREVDKIYNDNFLEQNQECRELTQTNGQNLSRYNLVEYLYYNEFNEVLSIKEKTLLSLRIRGLTNREIGKELGISHTMVSKMRRKMVEKYKFYHQ